MAITTARKHKFQRMQNHLRHVVSAAQMFDPRTRGKIFTTADYLWLEIQRAFKWEKWAQKPAKPRVRKKPGEAQ